MAAITGTVRSAIEVTDACIVRTLVRWAFDAARDDDDEGAAKPPPNSFRSSPTLKCVLRRNDQHSHVCSAAIAAAAMVGRATSAPHGVRASLRSSHNVAT